MNYVRKIWLLSLLFAAVLLWVANQRRLNSVPNVLARYPHSPEFDYAKDLHLDYKPAFSRIGQTTFYATWFPKGKPNEQIHSYISGDGAAGFTRLIFSPSPYNFDPPIIGKVKDYGRWITLNNTQFLNVREWLKQMPSSAPPDSLGEIVLVTFNQGTNYETRLYSRANLPQVVKDLCEMTAAPL